MGPPALPRLLARLAMGPEAYARASAGDAGGDQAPPAPELLRFGAHAVLALVALRLLPAPHDAAAPPSAAPLQARRRLHILSARSSIEGPAGDVGAVGFARLQLPPGAAVLMQGRSQCIDLHVLCAGRVC